jgi:plastocyanin
MRGSRFTLCALLAAGALALVACGRDEPYVPAADRTVSLRLDEYRVLPQRVTVPAGRVRLVGVNRGRLTHNLAVVQFDRPLGEEEERQYARTPTAHPGGRVETTVTLRPGKYRVVCTIANHDNLGQYGELKVTSPR